MSPGQARLVLEAFIHMHISPASFCFSNVATRKSEVTCVPGVRFLLGTAGLDLPEVLFPPTAHSGPGLRLAPPSHLLWFWHMFRPDPVWRLQGKHTPVGDEGLGVAVLAARTSGAGTIPEV